MKRIAVTVSLVALVAAMFTVQSFAAPTAKTAAVTITVTMTDFKFKLSKTSVPKGTTVTFKVVNKGNSPHDFDFTTLRKGTAYLAKGKTASYKVTFSKSGRNRYVCTVPRHIELGMAGSFTVK